MMTLTSREYKLWTENCKPGRLFFTKGYSLSNRFNAWYQRRKLKLGKDLLIPNHVGVIGTCGIGYQSTFLKNGPHRFQMGDLLQGSRRTIMIGELKLAPTDPEIIRGLARLDEEIESKKDVGYDWLSLITFGKIQENNSQICSEFANVFVQEALRTHEDYDLICDRLFLPAQLFLLCNIKLILEVGD